MNIAKKSAEKTAEKTVHLIDTGYMTESAGPGVAAAYLIVEGDRASFVENNTTHAVPRLLNALKEHGLSPSQVDYLIITHVHLDHAGGLAYYLGLRRLNKLAPLNIIVPADKLEKTKNYYV